MKWHAPLISGPGRRHQSLSLAAAAPDGGELGGVIGVGARADFGAACFFGAAGAAAAPGEAAAGRFAAAGAPARDGGAADPGVPGSGVMILTGGVEEADGNSIIVVGLPVGAFAPAGGGSAAMAPDGSAETEGSVAGAPQDPE